MTTHTYLNKSTVGFMGIWEEYDQVIGVLALDGDFGDVFCITLSGYDHIKGEMMDYAINHLALTDDFGIVIADEDAGAQSIAASLGLVASESKESDAVFLVDETSTDYVLPKGYTITSMKENLDLHLYGQVLWEGFNHELDGEGPFEMTPEKQLLFEREMIRPNVDLDLKIAVAAPDGTFASYCGMWYDKRAGFAVIEPVATVPRYRRMGLGKAAVLEGIQRVAALGAKKIVVGSSQQFYYSIGMRPYKTATKWVMQ